jgi:multiple sugar transport system permease protein
MEKRVGKYGYFFILPFFIVFFTFAIYPMFYTLYLSFTRYSGFTDPVWIGMQNYVLVFSDQFFWASLTNTLWIWGINFILQIGLAFFLVMLFSDLEYKVRGLNVFRIIYYLPNLIAATSVALIFSKVLDRNYGVINTFLFDLGWIDRAIGWLEFGRLAQFSVSGIQTWMWFGNTFILFIATVKAIDKEALESAVIDGATRLQILRFITIPMIKPIVIYVAITGLIGGLQLFEIPLLITDGLGAPNGSLSTVILYLFNHAFRFNNFGYASAIAYVLFLIILVMSTIFLVSVNFSEIKTWYRQLQQRRRTARE